MRSGAWRRSWITCRRWGGHGREIQTTSGCWISADGFHLT
jgi:hypothetical protein